jgi:hypothetical protein
MPCESGLRQAAPSMGRCSGRLQGLEKFQIVGFPGEPLLTS